MQKCHRAKVTIREKISSCIFDSSSLGKNNSKKPLLQFKQTEQEQILLH